MGHAFDTVLVADPKSSVFYPGDGLRATALIDLQSEPGAAQWRFLKP